MKRNVLTLLSSVRQFFSLLLNKTFASKRTLLIGLAALVSTIVLTGCQTKTGVLHPVGLISDEERKLLFDGLILMLIVVIPTTIMVFAFAIIYRKSKNAKYEPNWAHNNGLELVCWGIPCVLIVILGVWAWNTTHQYDPYRQLKVGGKPMVIQAVALRWKWLFIYPSKKIATLNYLEIPVNKQIEFQITSDAPMNAFFIPQLASQIYAMAGMRTRLHAIANKTGVLHGFSANFSGTGFTDMNYKVYVVSKNKFNSWAASVSKVKNPLTIPAYAKIAAPSVNTPPVFYSAVHPNLFNMIMNQFMMPHSNFYHRLANKPVSGV